jgi:hypothetical protein
MQKFAAREPHTFPDGSVGWSPGGPTDCLGPWAKVQHCAIDGTDLRRTCYATGYADTMFSIPACTRRRGHYIGGYLTIKDDCPLFVPYDRFRERLA